MPCTLIGGASGITLEFSEVRAEHRGETLIVKGCASDVCDTIRLEPSSQRPDVLHLDAVDVDDASPLPVTLSITDSTGEVRFDDQLTAHPNKRQPNGPDCPPTTWAAQVQASPDGRLRQIDGPDQ